MLFIVWPFRFEYVRALCMTFIGFSVLHSSIRSTAIVRFCFVWCFFLRIFSFQRSRPSRRRQAREKNQEKRFVHHFEQCGNTWTWFLFVLKFLPLFFFFFFFILVSSSRTFRPFIFSSAFVWKWIKFVYYLLAGLFWSNFRLVETNRISAKVKCERKTLKWFSEKSHFTIDRKTKRQKVMKEEPCRHCSQCGWWMLNDTNDIHIESLNAVGRAVRLHALHRGRCFTNETIDPSNHHVPVKVVWLICED